MNIAANTMSKYVMDAYKNSICDETTISSNVITVEGIKRLEYKFDSARLENHREIVKEILNQLSEKFKDGYSFLAFLRDKNDNHWTEDKMIAEYLVAMAIALELMFYSFPRKVWRDLPGGVPYLTIKG